MNKILLTISLFVATNSFAQVCVPGTLTSPKNAYILPDSATGLNHACPGMNYTQIMYLKAPKDTAINAVLPVVGAATITADIDSFVVDANVVGLPSYITLLSVPTALAPAGISFPKSNYTRMVMKGDSLACVKMSGAVPSGTMASATPLTINIRAYLSNMHSTNLTAEALIPTLYAGRKTDTVLAINDYKFIVDALPCSPAAVSNLSKYNFELIGNIPNPASQRTQIVFESAKLDNYSFTILNAIGDVVFEKNIKSSIGINYLPIDVSVLSNGIYLYTLSDGKNKISKKLHVNK
jgi:hypothetical protein